MQNVAQPPATRRKDGKALEPGVIAEMRRRMAGDHSRASLKRFGVSYATALAALAGVPISAGSHALIREALAQGDS